jgi:hypothetical protein
MRLDMGALTVKDFCRQYGLHATATYELLKTGKLDGRKAGRRTVITRESAEAWLASLPPLHAGDHAYGRTYGQGRLQQSGLNSGEQQRSAA